MPQRAGRGLILGLGLGLSFGQVGQADEALFVGRLSLPKIEGLRGVSGLEVTDDGTRFLAITDDGRFVTGGIGRDGGAPVSLSPDLPAIPMRETSGRALRPDERDAEGLVVTDEGQVVTSFERVHRVRIWQDLTAPATWMPDLPEVGRLEPNGGIEALAIDPDGGLIALPERRVDRDGIPVFRFPLPPPLPATDGAPADAYFDRSWTRAYTLPARGGFDPVGADFGPDGRLYLLERDFVPPFGFRSRVRRFGIGPDGPVTEETVLETRTGRHGNLEGLSVWRDAAGDIRLTMVADDNGLAIQRSEIVEYRLVRGAGDG